MDTGQLIGKYIELRDKVAAMNAAHDLALKPYSEAMAAIEGAVTLELDKLGVDNLKVKGVGTAFRKRTTSAKVSDREAFLDFVFDGRREGFLTMHVAKEAVEEYVEQHNVPPPGVDVAYIIKTQFRKVD